MGTESDCLKNFIRFFKEHPPTFAKAAESTTFRVGGKRYHYDDLNSLTRLFTADVILDYDLGPWWKMPADEKLQFLTQFISNTFRQDIVQAKKAKDALKEKIRGNGKADLNLPDPDYILSHLQPYRVLGDTRREAGFRFLDTKTKSVTDYDYYSIQLALKSGDIDKGIIDQFLSQILHVREDYNPHDDYQIRSIEDSNNVYSVNRYSRPKWMDIHCDPALPEEIDQLMRHLFPKEDCRYFVYSWIYHSLMTRCGTYLYLCGGQGSGKNTLATLIAKLHGISNVSNPKQDSFTGRFNQYLKFKRFVFFDEFNCRKRQDKDILKSIINDRIQIEAKGRDHEDIDIHASYFLANNSLEAIGLDPVDRRFSVPDVTHDSIIPVYGRQWMQDLLALFESDEYVAPFGRWILEEFKDTPYSNEDPYQKTRFEEIVLATVRIGMAETVAKILQREQNTYDYYEEQEMFRRVHKGQKYPSLQDWMKFLRDVRKDGQPLGVVEGKIFRVASEYSVADYDEDDGI